MSNNLAGIPGTRAHVDVENLFDVYCELQRPVVANNKNSSNQNLGSVTETFPTSFRDDKTIKMLQLFATIPSEFENNEVIFYSFVLTSEDPHWRFCFCRSEGKSIMLVFSRLPWHDIFYKMLAALADVKAQTPNDFKTFLANCYRAKVPVKGQITSVQVGGRIQKVLSLEQPSFYKLPSIPDNQNLTIFHNLATPYIVLSIIASLIFERRVIITSRYPDRHSACIQAVNALLYPMEWQHIFIPILPAQLRDYLMGPMPYLIGVPLSILETTCRAEIGDAIIFNCDAGTYETSYNDAQRLPTRIMANTEKQLRIGYHKGHEHISYVFLLMMVRLMGQYRDGIQFESNTPYFCDFAFLSKRHASKRSFLLQFLSTSMCVHFINVRLNMLKQESMVWDRFEMESVLHSRRKRWPKKNYKETDEICVPRNSLQDQLFNAMGVTESIKMQLERFQKSRDYKNAKTHQEMKELFGKYRYILSFATAAYNSIQAQSIEEINNIGYVEISSRVRTTDVTMNDKQQSSNNALNKYFG
ncbi:DENN domain-containing protein 1A-like [Eurosta solidaginis]|uniref:DENN domain-containing protein 1A-like n=1 Tax=Eurosta solidaginis TaxID=178769 RepID=UPI003530F63D